VARRRSGGACEAFAPGDAVFVSGQGLPASAPFDFWLSGRERGGILARYSSDRHGTLGPGLLIPYVGMLDGAGSEGQSEYRIRVSADDRQHLALLSFRLEDDRAPRLFSSDRQGRLRTGIEEGRTAIGVTRPHVPADCARVYLVRRQFGWRVGDPIEPVLRRDGGWGKALTRRALSC
jgi:hypothetical protein